MYPPRDIEYSLWLMRRLGCALRSNRPVSSEYWTFVTIAHDLVRLGIYTIR